MKYLPLIIIIFATFYAGADNASIDNAVDCTSVQTTLDVNHCMSLDVKKAEGILNQYLNKSLERYADDVVSVEAMRESQAAWKQYQESHCNAIYTTWREGTIRTAMDLDCQLKLIHERMHNVWSSYLTYIDSTPPILPEPKPYQSKNY